MDLARRDGTAALDGIGSPRRSGRLVLEATVFDLGGTLADSAATWARVVGAVAARHTGTPAIRSTGHWADDLARRCPGLTPEAAVAECVEGMVDALARGGFGLLPGAADLVAAAAAAGPVALVSASPARYVLAAVAASGLRFAAIVTGDDVARGKPAPDPYLLAARRLGVAPGRCLAVEDSGSGIRSAHAAGMTVLAIPNPATARDHEVLRLATHHAADALIATKTLTSLPYLHRPWA
ncbi:HAD-IA family hydrolase [Amycolatopsis sp., V23-08]|uniref:HAD-IA family hydrolase n=1 Tax=Amycolatopsis heterodermiae TaxID=3110235 RepID=A0ABU5RLW1_9PSEU|nr:HAD-IA family hydrolase [Amycolatopsis sp., V23-08]MEA5366800.1 HAD-IA family hydrolase [Amycolatopsis sp., V23-08]